MCLLRIQKHWMHSNFRVAPKVSFQPWNPHMPWRKIAGDLPKDHLMVMNMCGRGDKDIFTVARALGWDMNEE